MTIARTFVCVFCLIACGSIVGCGGVPDEASGTPVPEDYQQQQMAAQKAAQEAAMKNMKRR